MKAIVSYIQPSLSAHLPASVISETKDTRNFQRFRLWRL